MGGVDKEDRHLYLVNKHEEDDHDTRGFDSINLGKAFHGCNKVQVHYSQQKALELEKFEIHQGKYEVRYGVQCPTF